MYEIGTEVRYHGSVESQHGRTFRILGHWDGRYAIGDDLHILRGVRPQSITPITPEEYGDTEEIRFRLALSGAISGECPVMITYVAVDGEWTTRTIEPYALATTQRGDVIVRAMDRLRGEPRTFRIDRIEAATVLPGTFHLERPESRAGERAALARIRAEIAHVAHAGYGHDAARWMPGDPIV